MGVKDQSPKSVVQEVSVLNIHFTSVFLAGTLEVSSKKFLEQKEMQIGKGVKDQSPKSVVQEEVSVLKLYQCR